MSTTSAQHRAPRRPSPRPTGQRPAAPEPDGPISRTLRTAAPTITLHLDDVDDAYPGEWILRRGTGDTAEVLHRWHDAMLAAEAKHRATTLLQKRQIRVVDWKPGRHHDEFVADIGSTFDGWQVTKYSGRGGTLWRRNADGSFVGSGGTFYRDADALARTQGPLVPVEVHNLRALVDELTIFRQVAGYYQAPEGCLDLQCDEYFDNDDEPTGIELCSHVERRIATAAESFALARVVALVDTLESAIPPTDISGRNILSNIRQALEQQEDE